MATAGATAARARLQSRFPTGDAGAGLVPGDHLAWTQALSVGLAADPAEHADMLMTALVGVAELLPASLSSP